MAGEPLFTLASRVVGWPGVAEGLYACSQMHRPFQIGFPHLALLLFTACATNPGPGSTKKCDPGADPCPTCELRTQANKRIIRGVLNPAAFCGRALPAKVRRVTIDAADRRVLEEYTSVDVNSSKDPRNGVFLELTATGGVNKLTAGFTLDFGANVKLISNRYPGEPQPIDPCDVCFVTGSARYINGVLAPKAKVAKGTYDISGMKLLLEFDGSCGVQTIPLNDPSGGGAGTDIGQAFTVPTTCEKQKINSPARLKYDTKSNGSKTEKVPVS